MKDYSILRSKKGNAFFEVTTAMFLVLTLALAFISFYDTSDGLESGVLNDSFLSNSSKAVVSSKFDALPSILDFTIMLLVIILWISAIVAALFIDSSPVFIPIISILLTFIIYIIGLLANAFLDITSTMATSQFPYTMFVLNHLVLISTLMGFSVMITMFAKLAR
jgi:hypothetical protein